MIQCMCSVVYVYMFKRYAHLIMLNINIQVAVIPFTSGQQRIGDHQRWNYVGQKPLGHTFLVVYDDVIIEELTPSGKVTLRCQVSRGANY